MEAATTPSDTIEACSTDELADVNPTLLLQTQIMQTTKLATDFWDEELVVVGVDHKSGSALLNHMFTGMFGYLEATFSCREHAGMLHGLTVDSEHTCSDVPECNIHFNNAINGADLIRDREEAASKGIPMRAVTSFRDPFEMIVSATTYHVSGEEDGGVRITGGTNVTGWRYEDALPIMAQSMLGPITSMFSAYQAADDADTYTIRYEEITSSSENFDHITDQMIDFVFGPFISAEQRQGLQNIARIQDLHRIPDEEESSHVSEDEDKDEARACLSLMDPILMAGYEQMRAAMGYT